MNINAQIVTRNLNVLSLRVMSRSPALRAMMNALNGLCPLAVLRAAVTIRHRPAQPHVQAAQAKTAVPVIEKPSIPSPLRGGRRGGEKESMCSASVSDMMPTVLWRDVP
jgi:hypothetical protein